MVDFDTKEIMEQEETALATTQGAQMATFSDSLMADVTEQGYWASFNVETMEDKKRLYRARNDNELLSEHMGEVIALVDVVIDTMVINDAQVGAKTVPCVHLIAEDGKIYRSASIGVVNKACDIISTFGMPSTWGGSLEIVCEETTTAKGFRYKYLNVVE